MERIETLLIDELREGDMAALAILVEKYKRARYRVAVQITKNHEDANDVMQDTFLKCMNPFTAFRKDAAFETWLYRIVVNHATNLVKRRERRRESPLSSTSEMEISSGLEASHRFDK